MTKSYKRISRLLYIILLTVFSYNSLIADKPVVDINAGIYQLSKRFLTEHFYLKCPNNILVTECIYKASWGDSYTSAGRYMYFLTYQREKSLDVGTAIIHANKNYKWGDYRNSLLDEFNEKNKINGFTWQKSSNHNGAQKLARNFTDKTVWVLFLICIFIIWFTRNKSEAIVNYLIALFKKI